MIIQWDIITDNSVDYPSANIFALPCHTGVIIVKATASINNRVRSEVGHTYYHSISQSMEEVKTLETLHPIITSVISQSWQHLPNQSFKVGNTCQISQSGGGNLTTQLGAS